MHNMIIIHIPLFVNSLCSICPRIVQNFRIPPSIFCRNQHNLPFLPLFCTGFPLSVPVGHPPVFYKSCIFCAFFRHTCTHNIHNFQDHPEKTPSACRFLSGAAKPGTPAGARRQPPQRETPGARRRRQNLRGCIPYFPAARSFPCQAVQQVEGFLQLGVGLVGVQALAHAAADVGVQDVAVDPLQVFF